MKQSLIDILKKILLGAAIVTAQLLILGIIFSIIGFIIYSTVVTGISWYEGDPLKSFVGKVGTVSIVLLSIWHFFAFIYYVFLDKGLQHIQ